MSALLGADTRRVDLVAQGLLGHSQDIERLQIMAQRAIAELRGSWGGSNAEIVVQRWEHEVGPRLRDVSMALSTMAGTLRAQAEGQRQASGAGVCVAAGAVAGAAMGVVSGGGGGQMKVEAPELTDLDIKQRLIHGKELAGKRYTKGQPPIRPEETGLNSEVGINLAGADLGSERSALSGVGGNDNASYEVSAGKVEATASSSVDVDPHGNLTAAASASAAAYAGYAAGQVHGGNKLAHGTVAGKAFVGAEATGDASASMGPDKVSGHLGAEAFAGAKAEAQASGTVAGVTAAAGAEISYGIGAHLEADAELSSSKVGLALDIGATLGVGAGAKIDVSINPKEVIANLDSAFDDLGDALW
ncbi:MAG: hypothetical protein QOE58_2228 [Actinomycetota bacterium]|nr:hypothetical protein [Actinomycetota bacterium]